MAKKRTHLVYNKAPEGTVKFYYSSRFPGKPDEDEDEKTPNYMPKVEDFKKSLKNISEQSQRRESERNQEIIVPQNIICVEFHFHNWFNAADFEIKYREDFGLSPIKYFDLNKKALFAVVDETLFNNFIKELNKFIECKDHSSPNYNPNIKFIKEFKFHTTEDILSEFKSAEETVRLEIIDNIELDDFAIKSVNSLKNYLEKKGVFFRENTNKREIEITKIDGNTIEEIARNFDAVHSINSSHYRLTKPSRYGTNIKEYPFKLDNPQDELPIFGVIDTGVSSETPLKTILLNTDNSYGLNGMNPMVDEAFKGDGHGTGVAGFVSLGNQLSGDIKVSLSPDARILSIKVLGDGTGNLTNADVESLIVKAYKEFELRYFTLTICYDSPLKKGDPPSDYAYLLDKLSYELDILIFICTANYEDFNSAEKYPEHFLDDELNLCTPADSYNNIVIGAIGDNLESEPPITPEKYPISSALNPAFYTRKYNLDYESLTLKNGKLRKPDVIFSGGNLSIVNDKVLGKCIDEAGDAAIQYLSAKPGEPILRGVGTSFSTPLVSNIAAKILRRFPKLKPQTVKALIVNSCEEVKFDKSFKKFKSFHKNYLTGHGKPIIEKCIYSDDNEVTMIIEDSIKVNTVKSLPITIPNFLNDATKNKSLLGVEATICYRFTPIHNNQLAYCPVNIAFGIFKNVDLENNETVKDRSGKNRIKRKGISGGSKESICLVEGWSQDAYNKSKMLSNTQKVSYYIRRDNIINEENIFKIAVNAHFHKILPDYVLKSLPEEYEYSLAIRLWINSKEDSLQNKLYNELQQINKLEILPEINIEGEAEAEGLF